MSGTTESGLDPRRDREVPGVFNLRDVGGYPAGDGVTVWGVLFRSGGLQHLDNSGREALVALGLRTIVDLREDVERAAAPSALDGTGLLSLPRPIYGCAPAILDPTRPPTLDRIYAEMLAGRGAAVVSAIRELTRPRALPALVHCAAGKDRTGVVVALVLSTVGVPDDVVAIDYALTADRLPVARLAPLPEPAQLDAGGLTLLHAIYRNSPAEVMAGLLATVRAEYGDAASYLRSKGLTAAEIAALSDALVSARGPDADRTGERP